MAELEGPDVSIVISLKEHGIAWKIGETETRFYYGIAYSNGEYTGFDWADLRNDIDIYSEYDWADLLAVTGFVGMPLKEWDKISLVWKIQDLIGFYGFQNIFGSTYTEPMTYEEVING
jgi:hypothetical protein